jgi:hypothetical protein
MRIDVYMDYVVVEGQRINRPSYIGRSAWMGWWEARQGGKL